MNPYRKYRNARMQFNYLRRYIRLCRAWADNRQNYYTMLNSGWSDIVEIEVQQAKSKMDTLRQEMEGVDPDGVYRVRFEKEMKHG